MINIISAFAAITIYSRLCEMGFSPITAAAGGILMGLLVRYVYRWDKKTSVQSGNSHTDLHNKNLCSVYHKSERKSRHDF